MKKKYLLLMRKIEEIKLCIVKGAGQKCKKTLINFLKTENNNQELSDSSIINFNSKSILQTIDHIKLFSSFNPFDFGVISYFHHKMIFGWRR